MPSDETVLRKMSARMGEPGDDVGPSREQLSEYDAAQLPGLFEWFTEATDDGPRTERKWVERKRRRSRLLRSRKSGRRARAASAAHLTERASTVPANLMERPMASQVAPVHGTFMPWPSSGAMRGLAVCLLALCLAGMLLLLALMSSHGRQAVRLRYHGIVIPTTLTSPSSQPGVPTPTRSHGN